MAAEALIEKLSASGSSFELLPHRRTQTAAGEARALGVSPQETAKTLVVRVPEGYVRAVLPASERLSLRKLREALGVDEAVLVHEAELGREYPEFELGAVPPVGGAHEDAVVVDRRLRETERVVLEAGTHDESLRLRTADLVELARARVADISED